jgi:hypothetical protein
VRANQVLCHSQEFELISTWDVMEVSAVSKQPGGGKEGEEAVE